MTGAARALRLSGADVAITAAIFAWAVVEAIVLDGAAPRSLRVAFAVAVTAPMVVRNRAPVAAFGIAVAAFAIDCATDILPLEAVTPMQLLPLTTYPLAAFATSRRLAGALAVVAIVLPPALAAALVVDAPVTLGDAVALLVVQSVAAGAGWSVRLRREEADRQAASFAEAGRAGDELVREGIEEERARIARELRAIVARALAAMEASLSRLDRATPQVLGATAASLQGHAAAVMADLQRLLGVLPEGAQGVQLPVSAEASLAGARTRGWATELVWRGAGEPAAGAALAAGRVVEEVLAGEPPAGAQEVTVRIDGRGDGLHLRISGRGPAPAALGDPAARSSLRERARLHGGAARIVRRRQRWAVETELPGAGVLRAPWRQHAFGDLIVIGAASLVVVDEARRTGDGNALAALLVGALVFMLPLALRRRVPVAAVLAMAAGLWAMQLGGLLPSPSRAPMLVALLGSGAAAMHIADARVAFAVAVTATTSAVVVNLLQLPEGAAVTDTPIILFLFVSAWTFGRLVRGTMDRAQDARAGERALTVEHVRRLQDAVDGERRAVARDLHDVVGHGVSLVGVLAGAAAAQARQDPERARRALRDARTAVAQARAEVDRLTGALGEDDGAAHGVSLEDVHDLVDAACGSGQRVTCEIDAGAAPVPAGVAVSVYRIVQEALTNVRKHAPGAATTVRVARGPDAVVVEVRNGAAPPAEADGTRRGITGMQERARLLGGDLDAAPQPDGGFAVEARLPVA